MSIDMILNIASWHQRKADSTTLPDRDRNRHSIIAFKCFKVAHILKTGAV